jgi:hypothetical protein
MYLLPATNLKNRDRTATVTTNLFSVFIFKILIQKKIFNKKIYLLKE